MSIVSQLPTKRAQITLFFSFFALFCVIITVVIMCFVPREAAFEELNTNFFCYLLKDKPQNEIRITSLDGYYLDGWYYYHISYSCLEPAEGSWVAKDQVYFGQSYLDQYFDLNETLQGAKAKRAQAYHTALLQGEHKAFSSQEIETYTSDFYYLSGKTLDMLKRWKKSLAEYNAS